MISLSVLRKEQEAARFERLAIDDHRTAIASSEIPALEAELRRQVRGEVRFDAGQPCSLCDGWLELSAGPLFGVGIPRDASVSRRWQKRQLPAWLVCFSGNFSKGYEHDALPVDHA